MKIIKYFQDNICFAGEMAKLAVDHGADGILVSNHGARQLDGVPATVSKVFTILFQCNFGFCMNYFKKKWEILKKSNYKII